MILLFPPRSALQSGPVLPVITSPHKLPTIKTTPIRSISILLRSYASPHFYILISKWLPCPFNMTFPSFSGSSSRRFLCLPDSPVFVIALFLGIITIAIVLLFLPDTLHTMGQLVFVLLLFNLNILLFDNRPIILLLLRYFPTCWSRLKQLVLLTCNTPPLICYSVRIPI